MKNINFILFFTFYLLTGCASRKIWVESVANKNQKLKYFDGQAIVTSNGLLAIVSLGCGPVKVAMNETIDCMVHVTNKSEEEFDFGVENISVDVDGNELYALEYHDLKEEIEERAKSKKTWAAVAYGLEAMNASVSATSTTHHSGNVSGTTNTNYSGFGTYNNNNYNLNGYANRQHNLNYSGTSTTYDPSKANLGRQIAGQQYDRNVDRADMEKEKELADLRGYLRITTIGAKESYGGKFLIEELMNLPSEFRRDETPLLVKIKVKQEVHRFTIEKGFDD
jgi:hypothetical protein